MTNTPNVLCIYTNTMKKNKKADTKSKLDALIKSTAKLGRVSLGRKRQRPIISNTNVSGHSGYPIGTSSGY